MKRSPKRTLALVAHDGKKADMIAFVKDNLEFFKSFELVATATTGKYNAVIFMRDPLGMHPHDPDISSLLRICDVHNVPLAINPSTAQLIVKGLYKKLL